MTSFQATVRVLMRTALAKIKLPTQEPYRFHFVTRDGCCLLQYFLIRPRYIRVLVDFFNLLFGSSTESHDYWVNELTRSVDFSFFYHRHNHPDHPECKVVLPWRWIVPT